jgi:hypothetical protein
MGYTVIVTIQASLILFLPFFTAVIIKNYVGTYCDNYAASVEATHNLKCLNLIHSQIEIIINFKDRHRV